MLGLIALLVVLMLMADGWRPKGRADQALSIKDDEAPKVSGATPDAEGVEKGPGVIKEVCWGTDNSRCCAIPSVVVGIVGA